MTHSGAARRDVALSVVIIARNEERTIDAAVSSVLAETTAVATEVVVVDSASDDATVELAARHPVTVLRMGDDQPLSASAGRHVGFAHTCGRHVLFLDGDMTLYPGWLQRAEDLLAADPGLAVVTGTLREQPPAGARAPAVWSPTVEPLSTATGEEVTPVPFAAGAGLYRRDALVAAGGFNPWLRSDEEPDVGLRLRHLGHRIAQTSYPVAVHHSAPSGSLRTLAGRWRRGLFVGAGQNLRHHWGTPYLWPYVRERGYGLPPLLGAAVGIACASATVATRRRRWVVGWVVATSSLVVALAARARDLHRTAHSLLQRLFIAHGTVRGALMAAPPPGAYPGRVVVVSSAPAPPAGR